MAFRRRFAVGRHPRVTSVNLRIDRGYLQHSRPVGEANFIYRGQDDFEFPCQRTLEQSSHFTEVRLSADEWYLFRPEVVNTSFVSGGCTGDIRFVQVDGTDDGAELIVIGNIRVRSSVNPPVSDPDLLAPSSLFDEFTGELYNPQSLQLLTRDGRIVDLTVREGVTRVTSQLGHTLFLNRDSFIHSDGSSIQIERDSEGRVEQIRNTAGGTVRYQYSRAGNLAGVVDLTDGYTQFLYEHPLFPHQLTAIIDRRGNRVAAMDYTPEGRLLGLCDAEENCSENDYDIENREWLQMDPTRVPTRYEYNERGDVTAEVNAFGHRKEFAYDAYGRLLTETDALGNVTRFTRGRGGRVLTETRPFGAGDDPADFTTTTTYNDSGRRTSVTFASGGSYNWDYDATGEPIRMRDSEGSIIYERTYNRFSRVPALLNETNRFGTRSFSYSQSSLMPNTIFEADGSRTEQILNSNHQIIAWRNRVGQEMRFSYDDAQRPLTADYDNGITLEYEYGDDEDWVSLSGPTIGTYRREFSTTGRLVGWTLPGGDHYERSYDGAGRVRTETDELGNVTRYAYDAAGRLETITEEATGDVTRFEYDAAENLTRQVDGVGGETVYTYGALAVHLHENRVG